MKRRDVKAYEEYLEKQETGKRQQTLVEKEKEYTKHSPAVTTTTVYLTSSNPTQYQPLQSSQQSSQQQKGVKDTSVDSSGSSYVVSDGVSYPNDISQAVMPSCSEQSAATGVTAGVFNVATGVSIGTSASGGGDAGKSASHILSSSSSSGGGGGSNTSPRIWSSAPSSTTQHVDAATRADLLAAATAALRGRGGECAGSMAI